jgi:aminoglycoside/choline kinase family phosphotransferase
VAPAYGFIALEDYGDCPLATHWHHSTQAERYFWGQRAIDELIKMHTLGTQRYTASCPAFRLAFDLPKLLSELQFFRQHAIESLWQQPLTETERAAFDAAFTTLGTELAAQPRYFCHRDYHGWNIMVAGASVGLLDFQDARLGPQPYDLVSLLFDRGTLELLGQALLQKLVTYYLQQMEAVSGIRIDQQAFLELFDAVAVQRGLKAIGTFAYMAVVRQRPQYLPYIAPTLAYLRPLMERHSSCRALARLLPRRVPGWQ